jgi:ABC-type nitrate/sulfonate/bicarbonate transport system substrate-binding protein
LLSTESRNKLTISKIQLTALLSFVALVVFSACSKSPDASSDESNAPLRMAISPYQDTAFLVNVKKLGLEKKYGTKVELLTIAWEDILPAIASAGQSVDVGYASLTDYLTKCENLNSASDDPVLFIYPIWVFRGAGFVTFDPNVPTLDRQTVENRLLDKKFLSYKIGVAKNSMNQMVLFMLTQKAGTKFSDVSFTDISLNDGILATENGSLDIAAAGVTQRTEVEKRHGRVVLTMDTFGMGDIDGLACKASVYKKRKKDIEALIRMEFDCKKYVLSDLDHNSETILAYLKDHASTQYSLAEFKHALSFQYFPLSTQDVDKEILSNNGKYSIEKHVANVNAYLKAIGVAKSPRPVPKIELVQ